MSIIRVTSAGIEIEYTDPKSKITVLHKAYERDGEPVVEDYFKGRNGEFTATEPEDEPAPGPEPTDPEPEKGSVKVLGFSFKRK